jgi:hypothetical protein
MIRIAAVLFALQQLTTYAQSVTAESKVGDDGMGRAVVTNHSPHPVVAFTFKVEHPICRPTDKPARSYHGWDVATIINRKVLMPAESVEENIGGVICPDGVKKAAYAGPLSAVFDDGSTFGDTVGIAGILSGRAHEIYRLEQVIAALRDAQTLSLPADQIKSRLLAEKENDRKSHPRETGEPPYFDPFSTAVGNLPDSAKPVKETTFLSLLKMMDGLKEELANSKPAIQH